MLACAAFGVVHGTGLVATRAIAPGEQLVRVRLRTYPDVDGRMFQHHGPPVPDDHAVLHHPELGVWIVLKNHYAIETELYFMNSSGAPNVSLRVRPPCPLFASATRAHTHTVDAPARA